MLTYTHIAIFICVEFLVIVVSKSNGVIENDEQNDNQTEEAASRILGCDMDDVEGLTYDHYGLRSSRMVVGSTP